MNLLLEELFPMNCPITVRECPVEGTVAGYEAGKVLCRWADGTVWAMEAFEISLGEIGDGYEI